MRNKNNCFTPPLEHEHTFFELAYVYDGTCKETICNQELELVTGDLMIIPPGIRHTISVFDNSVILNCLIKKSTLHNIFFSFLSKPNILSAFFLNNIYSENGNSYVIFHTGQDADIRKDFLYIYWEYINKSMYYDQMMNNTLLIVFGLLIRKTTGQTFTDILQKIRTEKAQVLLQDTNLSVSNIAHEVGYENVEHFIRIFKKKLHMTPTEYRRIGYRQI